MTDHFIEELIRVSKQDQEDRIRAKLHDTCYRIIDDAQFVEVSAELADATGFD